jgi:Ca-activated chloride channel family protein
MKATHALSHARVAAGATTKLDLLVTFSADADTARRGLNVALVIDRSGSMAGSPLRHAITAAQSLVNQLADDDRVAVVIYDDTVETIVESQPASNRRAINAKIGDVRAAGCTNLHGGWKAGCTSVRFEQSPERVNRVLLLTDGQANEGLRDPDKLVAEARDQARQGIVTTTLGFGAQFNEDLLIGMAQAGEGHFYYIQSPEDAEGVFAIELEGLASLAAQGLVATIAPAPGVAVDAVLNRYPSESQGGATRATVGDVYGVEGRQLAVGLSVTVGASSGPATIATLAFEYQAVVDGAVRSLRGELPIVVDVVSRDEAEAEVRNRDVVAQALRLRIARAKEDAVALGDKGDHGGAAARLRTMIDALRADPLAESFEIAEEIEHLEHYADAFAKKRFDAVARKELRDQSYQATTRSREDLALRGAAGGSAAALEAVSKSEGGVVVRCERQGGKLRVHVASDGYDAQRNVQFPRSLREDGVSYVVDAVAPSADGSFYRVSGAIRRLVRPGEEAPAGRAKSAATAAGKASSAKAAKAPATAADLPTTTAVGSGVLVQCVKEGSKLRARVVSDGFDPNWNIRFPRSIREVGVLFVVDEVTEAAGGGSYVAAGEIKRLVQ